MSEEPFFGPVGRHLASTPPSTRALLALPSPESGGAAEPEVRVDAKKHVRAFSAFMLRDEVVPPKEAPCIFVPRESGDLDVVRLTYQRGGVTIDIGASFFLIAITITGVPSQQTPLESAKAAAAAFLRRTRPVTMEAWGESEGVTFGGARRGGDWNAGLAGWEETLHWWVSASAVGFVAFSKEHGLSKLVYSPGPMENRTWY